MSDNLNKECFHCILCENCSDCISCKNCTDCVSCNECENSTGLFLSEGICHYNSKNYINYFLERDDIAAIEIDNLLYKFCLYPIFSPLTNQYKCREIDIENFSLKQKLLYMLNFELCVEYLIDEYQFPKNIFPKESL